MEHHLHARMSVASTILDNIKRVTVDDSALSNLVSMLKELFRVDDAEEFEHIPNAELEPAFHNVTATFYMMPKIHKISTKTTLPVKATIRTSFLNVDSRHQQMVCNGYLPLDSIL